MAKDYYLVLGFAPDATMDQNKSAYRKMAKRWHPVHSQGESGPFQNIQEAYHVLGDAGRRKAYDEERAREKRVQRTAKPVRPEPVRRRSCPVEPLGPPSAQVILAAHSQSPLFCLSSRISFGIRGLAQRPSSSPETGQRVRNFNFRSR